MVLKCKFNWWSLANLAAENIRYKEKKRVELPNKRIQKIKETRSKKKREGCLDTYV